LLMKREQGVFDDLASSLETGAISRRKAIKLTGAALAATALGVFAGDAQAEVLEASGIRRRRCRRRGGNFCRVRHKCHVCCEGNRSKACCGRHGCRCCRPGQRCRAGNCGR